MELVGVDALYAYYERMLAANFYQLFRTVHNVGGYGRLANGVAAILTHVKAVKVL